MKKTIKIMLTLALVIAALCVTASAATNGFYDIGTAEDVEITAYAGTDTTTAITAKEVDVDNVEEETKADVYYEGSDRLGVTYSAATAGEDYGVILVEGSTLPTASSAIYYINQVEAADTSVAFDVYPSDIAATKTAMTLYISSSVEGAELVSVPMAYVVGYEEVVESEVMYGDVTDNGKHTVADLNRHALYWADPDNTVINAANADCTGNGKHTVADLNRHALYWADPANTVLGPAN